MRHDVELLRLVSALGIVWFHSGVSFGREVAYSGLVIFVVISVYFVAVSDRKKSIFSKVQRLLVPCLLWSIFYGLLEFVMNDRIYPDGYSLVQKLLATPSIHLWYLPFIFGVLVLLDGLKALLSKSILCMVSAFAAIVLILSASEWRSVDFSTPYAQYMHALPAVCLGVFLGCFDQLNKRLAYALLVVIFLAITVTVYLNLAGFGVTYFVGLLCCLVLLSRSSLLHLHNNIRWFSDATLGLYLVHAFILVVLMHVGINGVALPLAAFVISLLGVMVAKVILPIRLTRLFF